MKNGSLIVGVCGVLLLLGGLLFVMAGEEEAADAEGSDEVTSQDGVAAPPVTATKGAGSQAAADEDREDSAESTEVRKRKARKFANSQARDKFLSALAAARTRRESIEEKQVDEPPGQLDAESIRASFIEVLPLIRECYELALLTTPKLAGVVTLRFVISGEPEIGGIVEEVEFAEENEFSKHPVLAECFLETVMSLELPAPKSGGKVSVTYPIKLRPSE